MEKEQCKGGTNVDEITIQDLLGIFWKRMLWIVCAAMVCGSLAGIYYYGIADHVYTAEAVLYVLQTYQDSTNQMRVDTSASTLFAADYKVLIKTADVQEKTALAVGLPTVGALNAAVDIDINSVSGTRVLNVSVMGKDPELCRDVANAVSRVFIEVIRTVTKTDGLALVTEAQIPTAPSGPPRRTHTALAFLLGGILCYAWFVLKEMLNTRVSTDAQVEKNLQQPLLASVRDYRKEMQHYLCKTGPKINNLFQSVSLQTQESIRTLATNIQFVEQRTPLRTLTLTGATPNEGKSSLSLMMAQELAQEGLKILIVDMDFRNPSIGKFLKMRHSKDLVDHLMGDASLSSIIAETEIRNLSMIDSNHRKVALSRVVRSDAFDVFLNQIRTMFDLVIFDTPPLGMFIDAAVLAAKMDGAVVVIAKDHVEIKHAQTVVDQLKKGKANVLGVALNYVPQLSAFGYHDYGNYGKDKRRAPSHEFPFPRKERGRSSGRVSAPLERESRA